eukprot:m.92430 g.92430  ORF g.92430 m.92430 type:complete len:987 (+) comp36731_c0_seq28:28-2988(+)
MPSSVRVRVIAARNLPIMDRASDLTDAFAELKLGGTTQKTEVCRKNLNPVWNSEYFDFDIDDEELQDEPLQIRVMDYDTISAHDTIGRVYIDLTPLALEDGSKGISGWYPIFDTMHGIRGELNVQIRVKFIQDFNKFRQSSCGVKFFSSLMTPQMYQCCALFGFVEELVVNNDPEYQWIDKIRKARASNEARQVLFSRLSGALQRRIGLKVLEARGNAVLGYRQCFDLEGESGIVVRGIGTIAFLAHSTSSPNTTGIEHQSPSSVSASYDLMAVDQRLLEGSSPLKFSIAPPPTPAGGQRSRSLQRHRTKSLTSTDSVESTSPPKGDGLMGAMSVANHSASRTGLRGPLYAKYALQSEFPFFTLCLFPPGVLLNLGGLVAAHSVKLLDRINNPDEPETRDAWWTEIRSEIRSHGKAMGCNAIVGYSESTSICDELIVLSALGTAANLNLPGLPLSGYTLPLSSSMEFKDNPELTAQIDSFTMNNPFEIPYSPTSLPFPISLKKSPLDKKRYVPEVILSTSEVPPTAMVVGCGCFIQARVCKNKKKDKGESHAVAVSDALPFLQHDLHRQLLNKLKVKGMNAVFGLRIQVTVGESLLVAIASGTAVYLAALPKPSMLTVGEKNIQEKINMATDQNRDLYNLHVFPDGTACSDSESDGDAEDGERRPELDLAGTVLKPTLIAEVDDQDEADAVSVLTDALVPKGLRCCTTQMLPGVDGSDGASTLQMVTVAQKKTILHPQEFADEQFSKIFNDLLQLLSFKLYKFFPCHLCNLRFDCDLPDEDEVQLCVTGVVVKVCKNSGRSGLTSDLGSVLSPRRRRVSEDLQFSMEEIGADTVLKTKENRSVASFKKPKPVVQVTSMPYIAGAKTVRYLGNTNHFLIRESTSIREGGGLSAFMQKFLMEAQAIARAHVAAMGGNGLVTYRINECVLLENPMKNQGQCLLNISGDAVEVDYSSSVGNFVLGQPEPKTKPKLSETVQAPQKGLETAL